MGRLMLFVGIILIVVGVIGISSSMSNFVPPNLESIEASTQNLCNEGETLVEERGASEFTPGQGYGSSVRYFCENSEGQRREVTGEFVENVFGEISTIFPALGGSLLFVGLCGLGGLIAFIGFIVVLVSGGSRSRTVAVPVGVPTGVRVSGQPISSTDDLASFLGQSSTSKPASSAGDLAAKLRQLETARQNNLISQEEYDRMRQQILDSMQ
ncbi:MAG: SHOCT domain-containing protein [Anaerolineae bacterium]|nr:SHOCT domain-containing protein [Anaerolineae bacterium]